MDGDDTYLRHFLKVHARDTKEHFEFDLAEPTESNVLVMRGDETVGVVIIADTDDSTARLSLDYVTPRFRDFTLESSSTRIQGSSKGWACAANPGTCCDTDYLQKMGFRKESDGCVRGEPRQWRNGIGSSGRVTSLQRTQEDT